MFIGLFLTTIIAALSIINPYISGIIVDVVIQAGNYDLLPKLILCLVVVTIVTSGSRLSPDQRLLISFA